MTLTLFSLTIKTRLMFVCVYIFTPRRQKYLNNSHVNCTKMSLFMKRITSKQYDIQLIGFKIRIIHIRISHIKIFIRNFDNNQSVPHDGNEVPMMAQEVKIVH